MTRTTAKSDYPNLVESGCVVGGLMGGQIPQGGSFMEVFYGAPSSGVSERGICPSSRSAQAARHSSPSAGNAGASVPGTASADSRDGGVEAVGQDALGRTPRAAGLRSQPAFACHDDQSDDCRL